MFYIIILYNFKSIFFTIFLIFYFNQNAEIKITIKNVKISLKNKILIINKEKKWQIMRI